MRSPACGDGAGIGSTEQHAGGTLGDVAGGLSSMVAR